MGVQFSVLNLSPEELSLRPGIRDRYSVESKYPDVNLPSRYLGHVYNGHPLSTPEVGTHTFFSNLSVYPSVCKNVGYVYLRVKDSGLFSVKVSLSEGEGRRDK